MPAAAQVHCHIHSVDSRTIRSVVSCHTEHVLKILPSKINMRHRNGIAREARLLALDSVYASTSKILLFIMVPVKKCNSIDRLENLQFLFGKKISSLS